MGPLQSYTRITDITIGQLAMHKNAQHLFSLGIFSFRNMSCLRSYFWSLPQLIFGQYITVLKYNINQQRKLFVSQTNNRASVWNQTCQLKMCRIIYFYPILFQLNKTYFWLTNGLKTSPKNSFISMQKK